MSDMWREVGERVFVRRYRTWHGDPFDQNVGAVMGADGVVIIDTRASHRLADGLREDLRALTRLPIAAAVNTHHHWDHTWGNARFAGTPIWGHVRCAERVLADSERARQRILAEDPSLADELGEVVFTPPSRTFADHAVLNLGDRRVELRYIGRGHTDNDVIVSIADASVLFAGDLLENDAPPSFGDAYPLDWAVTAARLAELAAGAVVPGHGSIGDRAFAERQAGELADFAEMARQVVVGGIGQDEAMRRSPFPAETTERALGRAARELAGG